MFSKKVNQQQVLGVYRGNQAKKHRKRNRDNKTPLSCVLHFGPYSTFPWAPVTDSKKGTGRGENAKRLKWERYWRLPFPLFVRPPPPASLQKQTLKIYCVQSLIASGSSLGSLSKLSVLQGESLNPAVYYFNLQFEQLIIFPLMC